LPDELRTGDILSFVTICKSESGFSGSQKANGRQPKGPNASCSALPFFLTTDEFGDDRNRAIESLPDSDQTIEISLSLPSTRNPEVNSQPDKIDGVAGG
jgi:hypothetical protein